MKVGSNDKTSFKLVEVGTNLIFIIMTKENNIGGDVSDGFYY